MPWIQRMATVANVQFGPGAIEQIDLAKLGPGTGLADIAASLGIATTGPEREYLNSWPAGLQEAVRAALYSAVNRDVRLPVTIAWMPGYDFEVTVAEAAGTSQSIGGMTILMRSRYPADVRPA